LKQFLFLFVIFCSQQNFANPLGKINFYRNIEPYVYIFPDSVKKIIDEEEKTVIIGSPESFYLKYIQSLINVIQGYNEEALAEMNQIISKSEIAKDSVLLSKSYLVIGEIYYNRGEFDKSENFFNKSYLISQLLNDEYLISYYLMFKGKIAHSKGNAEQSDKYYKKSLEISLNHNFYDLIALVYNKIGKDFETIGNYSMALFHYNKAFEYTNFTKDKQVLSTTYNHLANIYHEMENYSKALEFHSKALELRKFLGYKEGIAKSQKNIGEVLEDLGRYKEALEMYNLSLITCKEIGYKKGAIKAYHNIGRIYSLLKKQDSSEINLQQALEISTDIGYKKGIIKGYYELGVLYKQKKDNKKALEYFNYGLSLAEDNDTKEDMMGIYFSMYQIYEGIGDTSNAFKYFKLYSYLNEYFMKMESEKQIVKQKVKFELEKKAQENMLLEQQNKINLLEIRKKSNQIILATFSIILLLALVITFLLLLLNIRKSNFAMKKMNNELQVIIHEKNKMFTIIAHELRNPLWWFKNLTDTLAKNYNTMSKEKISKALNSIDESAKSTFLLMDNLLQWTRSELNKIEYHPTSFDISELVNENLIMFKHLTDSKGVNLNYLNKEIFKVFADRQMISTVIRNIVSNALKFTSDGGNINIDIFKDDKYCHLVISDTGHGISSENLRKIQNEDEFSTLGTLQEKGYGIGLSLCKRFIKLNNGVFHIKSQQGQGTIVELHLPNSDKEISHMLV